MNYYSASHCTILWDGPDGHTPIAVLRHLRSLLEPHAAAPDPTPGIALIFYGARRDRLQHHMEPAIYQCLTAVVERLDGALGVECVISARGLASKPNRINELLSDLDGAIARLTIAQTQKVLCESVQNYQSRAAA